VKVKYKKKERKEQREGQLKRGITGAICMSQILSGGSDLTPGMR
jgi:hypothetical protein